MTLVKRFDHVGVTVRDLREVQAFFVSLGMEPDGDPQVAEGGTRRDRTPPGPRWRGAGLDKVLRSVGQPFGFGVQLERHAFRPGRRVFPTWVMVLGPHAGEPERGERTVADHDAGELPTMSAQDLHHAQERAGGCFARRPRGWRP